jgi:hypothetical protein
MKSLPFYLLSIVCRLGYERSGLSIIRNFIPTVEAIKEWKVEDPDKGRVLSIKHGRELNLLIGMYASELRLNCKAMLFSSETDLFSQSWATYEAPNLETALHYLTFKEKEITYQGLGDQLMSANGVEKCAILMAIALGADVAQEEINKLYENIGDGEDKLKAVVEFLKEKERKPYYHNEKKVDVGKYLESKFLPLHTFLARALSREELGEFYNRVYGLVKDDDSIVSTYFSEASIDTCTEYEKSLLEIGEHLRECEYHGKHNSAMFTGEGRGSTLGLLCNLLYNPEDRAFSLDHIPNARAKLRKFFEDRGFKPFEMDDRAKEEWDDVILDCDPFEPNQMGDEDDTAKNAFRLLNRLCGIEIDEPDLELPDLVRGTLQALCSYKQYALYHIYRDPTERRTEISIPLALPENRHIRMSLSCGPDNRKEFRMNKLSCARPDPLNLEADNLTDFMITAYLRSTYNNPINEPVTHPKALYFVGYPSIGLRPTDFAAKILDAILLCGDEEGFAGIRDRMHKLLSKHDMELSNAFDICHRHFMEKSTKDLGLKHPYHILEKAYYFTYEDYDNLSVYILKNKKDPLSPQTSMSSWTLSRIISRTALFGNCDLLSKIKEEAKGKERLEYNFTLSEILPGNDGRLDEKTLKYLLAETEGRITWLELEDLYRFGYDRCSVPQMTNYCVRLSEKEKLSDEDIRKICEWVFMSWDYNSNHLLLLVLKNTFGKLGSGVVPLYDLVPNHLYRVRKSVEGFFWRTKRESNLHQMRRLMEEFLVQFLGMLEKEALYLPHKIYLKIEEEVLKLGSCKAVGDEAKDKIEKLLLDIKSGGLTVADDQVDDEAKKLHCKNNKLNSRTFEEIARIRGEPLLGASIEHREDIPEHGQVTGHAIKAGSTSTQKSPEGEPVSEKTQPKKKGNYLIIPLAGGVLLLVLAFAFL